MAVNLSSRDIENLRPGFVAAAQAAYDAWDQSDPELGDPELGFGGICDLIADGIVAHLAEVGIDAITFNSEGIGENHTWVIAQLSDGVFEIDIPPLVYETGGGYIWRKRPNVQFSVDDVVVFLMDPDPEKFWEYTDSEQQFEPSASPY